MENVSTTLKWIRTAQKSYPSATVNTTPILFHAFLKIKVTETLTPLFHSLKNLMPWQLAASLQAVVTAHFEPLCMHDGFFL
jgi:hypothetical protein